MGNITETTTFEDKIMKHFTERMEYLSEKYLQERKKVHHLQLKVLKIKSEHQKKQINQYEDSDLINKGWLEALDFFENELKKIQETS
tara:strand:- start:36 stop:296 length:261 start_codon:yes stop_codon:yes gene_type:complete